MRKAFGVVVIVVVAVAAAATGYVLFLDRPAPPASLAGQKAFARTTLRAPDPLESLPPEADSWLVASGCPSRVTGGTAYVDLCWVAMRQRDEDPSQDFYSLHVGGTFGGARWLLVEARPLDAGPLLRTEGQPRDTRAGCEPMDFNDVPFVGHSAGEQLCGKLDAGPGAYAGVWHVNWACEPCLPWDEVDRPIQLKLDVVVEEGTLPNWDLVAGVGR